MNKIFYDKKITEIWRQVTLFPIFKEMDDIQDCNNYKCIRIMSHTLKLLERIIDRWLRKKIHVGRQQLGFMKGVGTTGSLLAVRQIIDKFREREKVLHMVFLDLGKAYGMIPINEVLQCTRERYVPEKYVRSVKETCM